MICFEILVNGELACRAGADDLQSLSTLISWRRKPFKLSADLEEPNPQIIVGGVTEGRERPQWLEKALSVGDELTIRIVESSSADQPVMQPPLSDEMIAGVEGMVKKFIEAGGSWLNR